MQTTTLASAERFVLWRSGDAGHCDRRYFPKLDFWRDLMPGDLAGQMLDADNGGNGASPQVDVAAGDGIPLGVEGDRRRRIRRRVDEAFQRRRLHG